MAAPRNDNVKEKILNATETLLQKKDLSDITLSEIAIETGISKGTLYYY
ncbi:MAG: TetR/AcrR family transcriptional regulator, partial [Lachnospiraceae bacterium]|nr:TetR/AcrR family transcriptional regulator [Lachnospiraceae bacterium]